MEKKTLFVIAGLLLLACAALAASASYGGLPALFTPTTATEDSPPSSIGSQPPSSIGSQPPSGSLALLNGTPLTPVPLNATDNDPLGTVYAVDYRTSPPHGSAPMLVRFVADNATTTPCNWTFGDGHSSTELDHFHTYKQPGTYTVTLTRGQYTANLTFTVEPPGVVPLPENEEMMF